MLYPNTSKLHATPILYSIVLLLGFCLLNNAQAQVPDWSIDPALYGNTMNVVGTVNLNSRTLNSDSDLVAAFVGDEIRGISSPNPQNSGSLIFLVIYANTNNESVRFEAYDAVNDQVVSLKEAITFTTDDLVGTVADPFEWTELVGDVGPPWIVKSENFSQSMELNGEVLLDPATFPDLPQSALRVAALAGGETRGLSDAAPIGNGRFPFAMTILGNTENEPLLFAAYDTATDRVIPLEESISFRAGSILGTSSNPIQLTSDEMLLGCGIGQPVWLQNASDLVPAQFPFTLSVTASVNVDGFNARDRLAALVAGELRGISEPIQVNGQSLYFLTIYGRAEGEPVTFQYYEASTDIGWHITEHLTFASNSVLGQPGDPLRFDTSCTATIPVSNESPGLILKSVELFPSYPNPFQGATIISFTQAAPGWVELVVFDLLGRSVKRLVNEMMPAGRQEVSWSGQNDEGQQVANGVYMIKLNTGQQALVRQVVRLN